MYARINGTRIFFDVEGMGWVPDGPILRKKPTCFVLHGGPGGDHTGYKPALSPLSEIMQLVYIDNRGSGRSAVGPSESYSLENNVEDIEALREYLGLEKIVLHGHSYGGMAPLYSTTHNPTPTDAERQSVQDARARANRSYQALNEGFGGFLRTFDLREQLPAIQAPALVMGARHDWITPVEDSVEIAGLIPQSELVIFEQSSHSVVKDEHAYYISTVKDFVLRRIHETAEHPV
ncbi:alpha/beta fold hydrolase [uncultured Brevibacillus sp.]|uniref:alpha/beta fold hydrolase n=1 Tax=uncultured Brevibacillus sp. TaxID=169970 RepID=UPI0025957C98|nr:alpha/beta fold hydrolase [uncultured Brevibacillus sp.]